MPRRAVFLRGMNLGKRRIKNPELVSCLEGLGYRNVAAFLASGNLVLDAKAANAALEKKLETGLRDALEYEVPTFVRSAEELLKIAKSNPFESRTFDGREGKLQVALLKTKPTASVRRALQDFESEDDWLRTVDRELYWWPRGGLSESELDLSGIAKELGPMTVRTHRTITRLVDKFFK